MKILYNNIVTSATITASSEASGFPWSTALNDIRLSRTGRTTGVTAEWLLFAFDTVQSVDYVALLGHNLTEDAIVTLEGNNTDSWGSPSFSEVVSIADNGNFYNNKRVSNKIYQDITNSQSGVAPAEFDHYNDENYGTQNLEEGSIYDSIILDLKNESEITWQAFGNVNVLFRDSSDGSSWSAWTSEVDATTINRRTKVLRYMQYRLFFNSPSWGDTTSYFELLSPLQEEFLIITDPVTISAYKYWRITIADVNNAAGYLELGGAFLGVALTGPGMNMSKPIGKRTNSEMVKSPSGHPFPNQRIQLKYAEIPFSGVSETDKKSMVTFSDYVDITLPFTLLIWENSLDIQPALYGNLTEIIVPVKENSDYVEWGFSMKVEECK